MKFEIIRVITLHPKSFTCSQDTLMGPPKWFRICELHIFAMNHQEFFSWSFRHKCFTLCIKFKFGAPPNSPADRFKSRRAARCRNKTSRRYIHGLPSVWKKLEFLTIYQWNIFINVYDITCKFNLQTSKVSFNLIKINFVSQYSEWFKLLIGNPWMKPEYKLKTKRAKRQRKKVGNSGSNCEWPSLWFPQ